MEVNGGAEEAMEVMEWMGCAGGGDMHVEEDGKMVERINMDGNQHGCGRCNMGDDHGPRGVMRGILEEMDGHAGG